ncbi:MAG: sulfate adenylyltransferase [Sandaracinaceae bacterium]|nr:sulfate adenylyltransferase [Sandaracinaceae bacterium]
MLTDGLKAEREQGITIDVAYRYFATPKRKFIIADTPGHVQYTRNMVTGASTADVALILIDARKGVLEQSRRHAFVASLLGIPPRVCINKMDLVDFSEEVFDQISADFHAYAASMKLAKTITCFPVSAKNGDNCVTKSPATPWYQGQSVLAHLETVPVAQDRDLGTPLPGAVRHPPEPGLPRVRGGGSPAAGEEGRHAGVAAVGRSSKVKAIDVYEGELDEAFTPQSVTIRLEDGIDVPRRHAGHAHDLPHVRRTFDAYVVWMNETPLDREKSYLIKHTTQYVRAEVRDLHFKVDMGSLALETMITACKACTDAGLVTVCAFPAYTPGDRERCATHRRDRVGRCSWTPTSALSAAPRATSRASRGRRTPTWRWASTRCASTRP